MGHFNFRAFNEKMRINGAKVLFSVAFLFVIPLLAGLDTDIIHFQFDGWGMKW